VGGSPASSLSLVAPAVVAIGLGPAAPGARAEPRRSRRAGSQIPLGAGGGGLGHLVATVPCERTGIAVPWPCCHNRRQLRKAVLTRWGGPSLWPRKSWFRDWS